MRRLIMLAGLVVGVSLLWAGSASAATFLSEDNSYIGPDQVVEGALYATGSTVTVAGTVNGDVFCAAQTVEISGTVNGDVICAAQQIRITGTVNDDVRLAGQIVTISGKVADNASVFGQTVAFESGSSVGLDLTVGAQNATLAGSIGRYVVGGAETVTISGNIGRDVRLEVDRLALASTARVEGGINYASKTEATVATGAAVVGQTIRTEPTVTDHKAQEDIVATRIAGVTFWLIALFIVGVVVIFARPRLLPATAQAVRMAPLAALGWGLLGLLVVPFLAVICMVTVIGFPLGALLLLLWLVGLILSVPLAGHAVGQLILTQSGVKMSDRWLHVASLAVGLLLLLVLSTIPFVGSAVNFVAVLLGMGALLEVIRRRSVDVKTTKKVKGKLV